MQDSIPIIIAGAIGAIITATLSYFGTKSTNQSADENSWRADLLKRQKTLEARVDKLDSQIVIWKARYWVMYRWIINNFVDQENTQPPPFHDMDLDALMEEDKKRSKK